MGTFSEINARLTIILEELTEILELFPILFLSEVVLEALATRLVSLKTNSSSSKLSVALDETGCSEIVNVANAFVVSGTVEVLE